MTQNWDANIEFPVAVNPAVIAQQSEAKVYVGAMNRSHQAFFLEKSTLLTS